MNKLPCDMVISFFRDGKFLWESSINEGGKGQSIENLISECNQICNTYGTDIDWEIGLVSVERGSGLDDLSNKIKQLSTRLEEIFDKHKAVN
jgi:hypothetical protein